MNIYILKKDNNILLLLYDGKRCVDIRCFEDHKFAIGQIINVRVKDVVQRIAGVFVDIGDEKNAYLSLNEVEGNALFTKKISKKLIVSGDELIVQLDKEPIKTKPYGVTAKISISGKGLVICRDDKRKVYVSKKIRPDNESLDMLNQYIEDHDESYSFIIRTNAENIEKAELLDEADSLWNKLKAIEKTSAYRSAPAILYQPLPAWLETVRDIRTGLVNEIITDNEEIYNELAAFVKDNHMDYRLKLYDDTYSLSDRINLPLVIKEVNNKNVWMKSGAYLVIEQTEALTSIDVNSGKSEKKTDAQSFYLEINKEAALEATRQIRLRNLSGIILIDFINMKDEADREEIISLMNKELIKDSVKAHIAGFTKLGLMEMTREKKNKPVMQMELQPFVQK